MLLIQVWLISAEGSWFCRADLKVLRGISGFPVSPDLNLQCALGRAAPPE